MNLLFIKRTTTKLRYSLVTYYVLYIIYYLLCIMYYYKKNKKLKYFLSKNIKVYYDYNQKYLIHI
jgi:hypothetical protein